MLHIILAILKFIGWLLLAVLLLLIAICLCLLFVPLAYRVTVEKEGDDVRAYGRISWMLRMVTLHFAHNISEGEGVKLNIFGITLFPKKEKKKKKVKKRKLKKVKKKTRKKAPAVQKNVQEKSSVPEKNVEKPEITGKAEEVKKADAEKAKAVPPKQEEPAKEEKTVFQKIAEKIKSFFTKIKEKLLGILAMLRKGRDRVKGVLEFIAQEETKAAFSLAMEQLKNVWRVLKPKRIRGHIHFGTGDPALTGQMLGAAGILYGMVKNELVIQPDFEQEVLEGQIVITGYIQLVYIIKAAWILYRDKNIKTTWKRAGSLF